MNKCVKCGSTNNLKKWGNYITCDKCFSEVSQWAQEFDISKLLNEISK